LPLRNGKGKNLIKDLNACGGGGGRNCSFAIRKGGNSASAPGLELWKSRGGKKGGDSGFDKEGEKSHR